jgi:hypothetical protein
MTVDKQRKINKMFSKANRLGERKVKLLSMEAKAVNDLLQMVQEARDNYVAWHKKEHPDQGAAVLMLNTAAQYGDMLRVLNAAQGSQFSQQYVRAINAAIRASKEIEA